MMKQKGWAVKNSTKGLGYTPKPPLLLMINRPTNEPETRQKLPTYTHPTGAVMWRYPTKKEVVVLGRSISLSPHTKQPLKLVHKSYWKHISPHTKQKAEQYPSLHITTEEKEPLLEDAISVPPGLEEDVKITVDELKEVNLDATTGHEALTFMDGSSGYNQIRMAPEDEELTPSEPPKGSSPRLENSVHTVTAISTKDEPLILYVVAQELSVGALLAQENEEGKENALYYLSGQMTPNKLNYSPIEKLCLALVFTI
ncbi:hypothetical protein LIER_37241 [Lithospermum erythrorhizon]|uniref:Reverse transcriptase RNase H-like domain-containing protein n=1 Tax=Lithospermum erythrorhizon TaxID=34254 RepID=A0AAV3PHI8_LITER